MTTSGKERQQKFREKQKKEGKKPVTVMLPAKVKELIDKEKERTGETITSIIERAVLNLFDAVTSNDDPEVKQRKKEAIYNDPTMKKLYRLIKTFDSSGTPPGSIATLLNISEYDPPDKGDDWKAEDVKKILREIKEFMPAILLETS